LGWLAAFVVLPLIVWVAAAQLGGFAGKSLSNLSVEPLLVAFASCVVFVAWLLMTRESLKPLLGFILLIILSAIALAVQHFVPGLRERGAGA
jgi:predicted branched-subunit amino acid permease